MIWLALACLAVLVSGEWARRDTRDVAIRQASIASTLHASLLRSELERHRSLPTVLSQDADLFAALASPAGAAADRLNVKLEGLATETRAAAIYLLDSRGIAVSASNWREPTSFVGSDYRFRPYFRGALESGEASFFALGTVSGRPGLYLARRLSNAQGQALGVIVAKVEFDDLEAEWRRSGKPTYVTDSNGVVLLTTVPQWRFRAASPLANAQRRRLSETQTSGTASLADLPFMAGTSDLVRIDSDLAPDLYARASASIPDLGWTVHLLSPVGAQTTRAIFTARTLALLSVALLAGLSGILLRRRQRVQSREIEAQRARIELEQQIDSRTTELRDANSLLNREISERQRLEKSRQLLQDELIQANKLATLGQIAAGVAHEVNQPLAAIRMHADSAGLYLERADSESLGRSLTTISDLTVRIGTITDELRAFSRKTRSEAVAVEVTKALDGALLLAGPRLRERQIRLVRSPLSPDISVQAERYRLEQVLLNLIQNAAEALNGTTDPQITVTVATEDDKVIVRVADNGPGVSAEIRDRLFTPFTTDKPDGMGLGLIISRDILVGFGGDLRLDPTTSGATFSIVLPRAA
ncbi:sensor histidine kinase [Brevundimonas variabilis]|uniref:sensor histidine kinase n=1 Tax=Brevundimonas variabilis TaxID=74312 RepID=UPI0031B61545